MSIHCIDLAFYKKKRRTMKLLRFNNQIIIHQGQSATLYKLTQGSALLLNDKHETIAKVHAPVHLNLIEHLYSLPAIKTVKALGKCEVQSVKRLKDVEGTILKQWKEQGLRKSRFQIFANVFAAVFYELIRLSRKIEIRQYESTPSQQGHFYLVASGSLTVTGAMSPLQALKIEAGEVIVGTSNSFFLAQSPAKLVEVSMMRAKALLGSAFKNIEEVLKEQVGLMQTIFDRNKRLNEQLRRNRNKMLTSIQIPREFVNKIQQKVIRFEKYCRAKSCVSLFLQRGQQEKACERKTTGASRQSNGFSQNQGWKGNRKNYSLSATTTPTLEQSRSSSPLTQLQSYPWKSQKSPVERSTGLGPYEKVVKTASGHLRKRGWEGKNKGHMFESRQLLKYAV